jgi:hypothetical protein
MARAHWRLLGGYCPSCNSGDARTSCDVCQGYEPHRDTETTLWPPSAQIQARWLERYRERIGARRSFRFVLSTAFIWSVIGFAALLLSVTMTMCAGGML